MQAFGLMGDERHKKSPPEDEEEIVTDGFRREVRDALDANREHNVARGYKKGDKGYLISSRSELAEATDIDPTLLNRTIGPKKPSKSKTFKLVDRSRFLGRIREALAMNYVEIKVPRDRAHLLRRIAHLPDDRFLRLEKALGIGDET